MKFGKEFGIHLEKTLPEWRDKYLCYKLLKKHLKNIPAPISDDMQPERVAGGPPPSAIELQEWFVGMLNEELEKFNDFYVDKEEDFIIRFQALKERIDRVKEKSSNDGVFTSESEFSEEVMEIRKDFVSIHGEMVLLKNYSSLNFAGLIKILKKYDKRTGELLSLPFTQLAFQQPFFTTEPLSRLVRECEAKLELLFPLEAEVVESANAPNQTDGESGFSNTAFEATLREETIEIFRSTFAAVTTIQGMKKESSTYNPMSLSFLFGKQGNENTGDVTAENSPSGSLENVSDVEDANKNDSYMR